MIRQAQPRGKHPIHQLLWTLHILPHRHQLCLRIVNHIQRRNARPVIPQQTLQTTQSHARKVREEAIRRARGFRSRPHGNETMEVIQHSLHRPRIAVLSQRFHRILRVTRGTLVRIVRHLGRRGVGGGAELTKSLELVEEFVEDVEAPFGEEVEGYGAGGVGAVVLGRLVEEEVEELTVGVPSGDAIADGGAFDRLEVTEG
mmetsp:Transcript_5367/g.10535  ORF Transcript_5367/g.10535 Transcript_5367/m.10535 type:complete len:201 (+) Transcript_5367:922-1524(+)